MYVGMAPTTSCISYVRRVGHRSGELARYHSRITTNNTVEYDANGHKGEREDDEKGK